MRFSRGGMRQRVRQDAAIRAGDTASGSGTCSKSTLANELLQRWSLGSLSAATVQKLALCATKDGLQHPDVKKLAALGGHGRQPQNCQRDMLHWLQSHLGSLPSVVQMDLPLRTGMGQTALHTVQVPLLPLHRMVAHMYEHWPEEFKLRVSGQPGAVEEFWGNVKADDPIFWPGNPSWKEGGTGSSTAYPLQCMVMGSQSFETEA